MAGLPLARRGGERLIWHGQAGVVLTHAWVSTIGVQDKKLIHHGEQAQNRIAQAHSRAILRLLWRP